MSGGNDEVRRAVVRQLPTALNEHEMAGLAREIGRLNRERQQMESQAKIAGDQWKDRIRGIEARVADLATKADEGTELRDIECVEVFDYRLGEVRVQRCDTGEPLETRPMTATERQPALPNTDNVVPMAATSKRKRKPATIADADPDAPPPEVTDPQGVLDGDPDPDLQ